MENLQKLKEMSVNELLQELRAREVKTGKTIPGISAEPSESLREFDNTTIIKVLKENQKVIYGTDDRADIYQLTAGPNSDDTDSVVALFSSSGVINNGNGTSTLQTVNFGMDYNLCTSERFRNQPKNAFCSGFLVAPDIIATAGHCVNESNVTNVRFVFGFRMRDQNTAETVINNTEIYSGVELLGREEIGDGPDWALVRIDRPVTNHRIAQIRRSGRINDTQTVHVIGHPCGLPTKFAGGASVRDNQPNAFFTANLDTYGGNSGSPVFNSQTHEVEGILVRGETDFASQGTCNVSLVCPSTGCRGEDCTRTTEFAQLVPAASSVVVTNFGYVAGNWRVEHHPRFLDDLTGDRRADIIGFGNGGVYVSLNNGNGTFQQPRLAVNNFGYEAGKWRVEQHPRFLADLTGDRRADIVGFGDAGVYVSFNNGNGTFQAPRLVINNFGYEAGKWRVEQHPRYLADLTGDGRADIVGFGNGGVYVSLNNGDGTFQAPRLVIDKFGYEAGKWRVEQHPRFLADLTGDGRADIIGFGNAGVYVSLNNGDGTFQAPRLVIDKFGYEAGNWRVEQHPRFLADLTGDGRADIIGFGNGGVYVSLNNGDGTFQAPKLVVNNFGYEAGKWRVEQHPRFLADLTGDGRADIVGFGDAGVYVSFNNGNGTFQSPRLVIDKFGYEAGNWRVEKHPRFLADLTGDGRADVIGFGNAGVYVSLNSGSGTF